MVLVDWIVTVFLLPEFTRGGECVVKANQLTDTAGGAGGGGGGEACHVKSALFGEHKQASYRKYTVFIVFAEANHQDDAFLCVITHTKNPHSTLLTHMKHVFTCLVKRIAVSQ